MIAVSTGQFLLAMGGFAVVLIVHAGALFYWGGQIKRSVLTMENEIVRLRDWKHDEAQRDLTQLKIRVGILEEKVGGA